MKHFAALLFAFAVILAARGVAAEPPNIVLVMADDQGWGEMGYQGHPRVKTPNFDAVAREGIRFDRFYAAAPVCSPTRGSVMTGRTPNRYGCFSWGHTLRPQEVTIAEALKTAGYRTGHFGKWHVGSVQKASPVSPGASGFDEWASTPNFFDLDPILSVNGKATQFKGDSSDVTVDVALQFIRRCAEQKQRFLAVVWFGSPHAPFQALPEDSAPYKDLPEKQQHFLGEITGMDRAFGRLRDELRRLNLRDNTVLWYCSDNGALPEVGSSGGKRALKGSIYDGGLAVPALLEWPALPRRSMIVAAPCVTSDIYPTVLEMAGVTLPKQPPLDGVSLLPLLNGTRHDRPTPIGFWDSRNRGIGVPAAAWMADLLAAQSRGEEPNQPERLMMNAGTIGPPVPVDRFPGHAAWLDWPWKLHRIQGVTTEDVKWELYDIAADPGESRVLTAEDPSGRLPALKGALENWLGSVARSLNGEDYR